MSCRHLRLLAAIQGTGQETGTFRSLQLIQVVGVDVTVEPPSFAVDLGESVRETEAHRLRLRHLGTAPPSVPAPGPLPSTAPEPQIEDDDDFGDFAEADSDMPWASTNGHQPHQHQSHQKGTGRLEGIANGNSHMAAPQTALLKPAQHSLNTGGGSSGLSPHQKTPFGGLQGAICEDNDIAGAKGGDQHHASSAAAVLDDDDDFGDFADGNWTAPEPTFAAEAGPQSCNAQGMPAGTSSQHARGPSVDSAASGSTTGNPLHGGFADFGLANGASFPGSALL